MAEARAIRTLIISLIENGILFIFFLVINVLMLHSYIMLIYSLLFEAFIWATRSYLVYFFLKKELFFRYFFILILDYELVTIFVDIKHIVLLADILFLLIWIEVSKNILSKLICPVRSIIIYGEDSDINKVNSIIKRYSHLIDANKYYKCIDDWMLIQKMRRDIRVFNFSNVVCFSDVSDEKILSLCNEMQLSVMIFNSVDCMIKKKYKLSRLSYFEDVYFSMYVSTD